MNDELPFALAEDRRGFPFFLAPVAGYSDAAYRALCYEHGAGLCYTEMVSAEALVRHHPKTRELLQRDPAETVYAIQLFGSNPDVLARAAEIVAAWNPAVIDLNCGCPVPKIVRSGAGSALLKEPRRIGEIVRAMRSASSVPVSVKIRKGWDAGSENYLEVADIAIDAGACAITLHGRTRAQGYAGTADWDAISKLVQYSSVPVFGSGDVFSPQQAIAMREETGCAGVMIARGAMGNPFIFEQIRSLLQGTIPPHPSPAMIAEAARRHLLLAVTYLDEHTACIEFRKHFCAYTKGHPGGAALRAKAVTSSTFAEFEDLLYQFASHT